MSKGASWADDIDASADLPSRQTISHPDGTKSIIEYKYNDDGAKVKVTRKIRIVKHKETLSKAAAARKNWAKFGDAKNHGAGPNTETTSIGEQVFLKLTANPNTLDDANAGADNSIKAKLASAKNITCRSCGGPHWTSKCPYKGTLVAPGATLESSLPTTDDAASASNASLNTLDTSALADDSASSGKYVPPSVRARQAGREPEGGGHTMRRDDTFAIRISNLSEDTDDGDLQDLVRSFGSVSRTYLAKDKMTGASRGYAFVNFHQKEHAERAIEKLDGYGYANLILRVEWAKARIETPRN